MVKPKQQLLTTVRDMFEHYVSQLLQEQFDQQIKYTIAINKIGVRII